MGLIEAWVYGIVQGITEYLPVSSSAHLILLPRFLGTEDPGLAFDVFLHIGTLLATLTYFWRDWFQVFSIRSGQRLRNALIVGTVPALLVGALVHKWVETSLRGNLVIAVSLAVGGIALYFADRFCDRSKRLSDLNPSNALTVGFFQCLALIPGMSRSGSTILGGRLLGLDRDSSARFSFLLSAPVTGAAILFELRHWKQLMNGPVGGTALCAALLGSFLSGCLAIGGLLALLKRFGYGAFAIYRVLLGIVILKVLGP